MAQDKSEQVFDIRSLEIEVVKISAVKPSPMAPRLQTPDHDEEISASIGEFGMIDPLLVDETGELIAGESTFRACKLRGMSEVPVIRLSHFNDAQKVALRIAHDRLCEKGQWSQEKLAESYHYLMESEYEVDLEVTGYEIPEIDVIMEGGKETIKAAANRAAEVPEEVELDDLPDEPVSKVGDVIRFDKHVIVCGNATTDEAYRRALGNRRADLGLTDSPYNVKTARISGRGKTKHADFIQGSGEMSSPEFRDFIEASAAQMAAYSRPGAYNMFFTGWYSLADIMAGCSRAFGDMSHMCIWAKTNGGLGSPWRNAWEGILVYRKKGGRVQNNIQLGRFGRNRTDVFNYAGANVFRRGRMEELRAHPTCKPVALLKDIILDITPIGGLVLDPFLGSGSSIIAAHQARRIGVGIELDPRYVDVAIQRIEAATGIEAVHEDGRTFAQLRNHRKKEIA